MTLRPHAAFARRAGSLARLGASVSSANATKSRYRRSTPMSSATGASPADASAAAKAPAPAVAMTTPLGPRIHALAIYLRGFQVLSYQRLRGLFGDAFGLAVSEVISSLGSRAQARFAPVAQGLFAKMHRDRHATAWAEVASPD